jgi:hypothetical protein
MWVALAVFAALETAAPSAPPVVELTRTGAAARAVSAAPRTLSDVARERREGRTAVGGFSAVETTVSRGPVYVLPLEWEEEAAGPDVAPEPEPPGVAVPYAGVWNGGWWGGAPARRPPHVHPVVRAAPGAGRTPSPRAAATPAARSLARTSGFALRGAPRRP